MNKFSKTARFGMGILTVLAIPALSAVSASAAAQAPAPPSSAAPSAAPAGGFGMGRLLPDAKAAAAPHTMTPYFVPAINGSKAPDADGFLQRWLILEPINKPNRSNTVFTDTYVRKTLTTEYFPDQMTAVPKKGDKVTVGDQQLTWHAVDATNFDAKLFNFAWGLNKQTYGVIFWAVTIVNSPRERKDVRLAVGSNSASDRKLDAKLFNFAWGLNKQTYGVIFWAVTIVNSPRERKDVRLAVGSNSA